MKKIFFLLASVILLACSENERMVYDEHMHDIYYSIVTDTRDSLYVSLLMADQILETTVDVKTAWPPTYVGKCIDQAAEI